MAVYGQFVWPYGKFHVISIQQCIQYPVAIPLEYDEREHKIVKLDSVHFHIQWKQIRQTNTKWSVCRFVRTYTINSGCDTLEYQGCALYDCYESHIYIWNYILVYPPWLSNLFYIERNLLQLRIATRIWEVQSCFRFMQWHINPQDGTDEDGMNGHCNQLALSLL